MTPQALLIALLLGAQAAVGAATTDTPERGGSEVVPAAEAPATTSGPPLVELHGGFYQVFTARGSEEYSSSRAWHAQLTLRTPAWRRWRIFGALETAPQAGAAQEDLQALGPWLGGEANLGISWEGLRAGPWSLSPAIAGGLTAALGADRERIEVEPLQALAGVRLGAGEPGDDWRLRAYVGYGIREQIEELPPEGCADCDPATEADRRWAWVADVLVSVPGLPAGAALRVKLVSTQARVEAPGGTQWLVGFVAGVP